MPDGQLSNLGHSTSYAARRCREYGMLHGVEGGCHCDMRGGYDEVPVMVGDAALFDQVRDALEAARLDLYEAGLTATMAYDHAVVALAAAGQNDPSHKEADHHG